MVVKSFEAIEVGMCDKSRSHFSNTSNRTAMTATTSNTFPNQSSKSWSRCLWHEKRRERLYTPLQCKVWRNAYEEDPVEIYGRE